MLTGIKSHCPNFPALGEAMLVFDLSRELRRIPLSIQVKDISGPHPQTIAEVPPKTYPTGIATVQANFEKPGSYVVRLNPEGGDAALPDMRFDLTVG